MVEPTTSAQIRYIRAKRRVGRVGFSTKVYQGLGAIADALKTYAFGTLLLFYYNQVLGLSAVWASAAIALALTIDAVLDPLIGSWSDNFKSRFGRRHPFMYASALPLGIALYMVFSPPALAQQPLTAWLVVTVAAVNISMSFFVVPWTALYAELSDDYAERTSIVTYRFAIGWLSALTFVFITWTFIFPSSPVFKLGQLNPHGYHAFALVLSGVVFAAVLLTAQLTLRETPYLMQPDAKPQSGGPMRFMAEIRSAFSNRDFVILFMSALSSSGVMGTVTALSIYLQTYFWGLTSEQLRWFSLAVVGAALAFSLVGWIERRLDKKLVLLVCFSLLLIDGFALIGLRLMSLLPPNGDPHLIVLLVINEIAQIFLGTVVSIMFISMLADTLDVQELRTGRRQEGVFAAALTFSSKATAGIGAIMAGLLLDGVLHWPANATPAGVGPERVFNLGVVAGMAAPALLILPLLMITRYAVTRSVYQETRRLLDQRRIETLEASHVD